MRDCCDQSSELEMLRKRQSGTLKIVLAINAVMFLVIVAAALYARSSALLADSLDNLGDAFTYGLSLWAVHLGIRMKARVAFFKGLLILLAAFAVLAQIGYKLINPTVPLFEVMGIFSLLALAANGVCLALLWRHKTEDINMSSVWECSRNDIVANISVFVAAAGVWATGSNWPDLLVASFLVVFLLRSASRVLSSAHAELQRAG
jgi:Co/Zn/Cd efflux system component